MGAVPRGRQQSGGHHQCTQEYRYDCVLNLSMTYTCIQYIHYIHTYVSIITGYMYTHNRESCIVIIEV